MKAQIYIANFNNILLIYKLSTTTEVIQWSIEIWHLVKITNTDSYISWSRNRNRKHEAQLRENFVGIDRRTITSDNEQLI